MSRAKKVGGTVDEMRRVANEARTNSTSAEDTLSAIEDREARRATRSAGGGAADTFPALGKRGQS